MGDQGVGPYQGQCVITTKLKAVCEYRTMRSEPDGGGCARKEYAEEYGEANHIQPLKIPTGSGG